MDSILVTGGAGFIGSNLVRRALATTRDRVVVLDFGKVIASGAPDEVRADPAVEEAYLGLEAAA